MAITKTDYVGEMMDFEKVLTGISKEIETALKAMEKAKDPDEKLLYSEVVKNLSESLGVFLNLMGSEIPLDEDGEEIPF